MNRLQFYNDPISKTKSLIFVRTYDQLTIYWRYFSKLSHRYHRQKNILIEHRTPVQIGNSIFCQNHFKIIPSFHLIIWFIVSVHDIKSTKIWMSLFSIPKWHCDWPILLLGSPWKKRYVSSFAYIPWIFEGFLRSWDNLVSSKTR